MNTLSYMTRITEDWAMLTLSGKLDSVTTDRIIKAGQAIITSGIPNLKIDMSQVDMISSAGIRALVLLNKEINAIPGGMFEVIAPSNFVAGAIKMAGLGTFISENEVPEIAQFLEVYVETHPDGIVMKCSGSLNVFSVKWLVEEVRTWLNAGYRNITLDAEQVNYLSSAGIRSVLLIYKEIMGAGGHFAIANPSAEMFNILKMVGLQSILMTKDE